jgi:repressor LexA
MTPKQGRCLDVIDRLTVDGVSPSYDEIKVAMGLRSKAGMFMLVERLIAQGYLVRQSGMKRTLKVLIRPDLSTHMRGLIKTHGLAAFEASLREIGVRP